jgi:transcriptional antiterminator RfaH
MENTVDDSKVALARRWYAIHTHPKQENRVEANLIAWNVETFNPKLRASRSNPFTSTLTYYSKPLFPRYMFARFNADALAHKVIFTRGVHSIVQFNDGPVPIDDEVIAFIKAQVREDGFIRIGEPLRSGDKVVVTKGQFKDLTGLFEHQIVDTDRVMILLLTINYQAHIILDRSTLKKVEAVA